MNSMNNFKWKILSIKALELLSNHKPTSKILNLKMSACHISVNNNNNARTLILKNCSRLHKPIYQFKWSSTCKKCQQHTVLWPCLVRGLNVKNHGQIEPMQGHNFFQSHNFPERGFPWINYWVVNKTRIFQNRPICQSNQSNSLWGWQCA